MEIAEPSMTNSWWSTFRPICIADIVGQVETDSLPVSRIDSEIIEKKKTWAFLNFQILDKFLVV